MDGAIMSCAHLFEVRGNRWNTPNWQHEQLYPARARDPISGENLSGLVRDPGFPENPVGPSFARERRPHPSEPRKVLDPGPRLRFNFKHRLASAVLAELTRP